MLSHELLERRKLNIGCGFDKRADYLNIDSDPNCAPDLLIVDNDLSVLPEAYFERAIALDVLEHIPRAWTLSALYDWVNLIKMGGRLFVETSYIYGIIDVMRARDDFETCHNWKICLFGNQAHSGDFHFNGFTVPTLRTYLRAVGLVEDGVNIRDQWLIQAWATKIADWHHLESIEDYAEFLDVAFRELLDREPEPERRNGYTAPNSPARKAEIKTLICSQERLYKIGAALEPLEITTSVGPPVLD